MKVPFQIVLINFAVVLLITSLMMSSSTSGFSAPDFMIALGLTSLGVGLLDILIAVILFLTGKENYERARGFLLSGGVLLLLGFAVCGGSLSSMH